MRMNKINDDASAIAVKISESKNEMLKNTSELRINIESLKGAIKSIQEQIRLEVKGLHALAKTNAVFAEKLAKHDKDLDDLKECYGKIILLERNMGIYDNNNKELNQRVRSIAEKVGKISKNDKV